MLEMEDQLLVEPGFGEMAVKLSEAQINVPDQPTGVGVVVGKAAGEFPYFAEIVANGSGEQRLAIQIRVMVAEAQAQRRHRKRMLEQAADPRVVYALGGGGGEQRDADGLVLKDGQDKLAPRLVREFLAADGFELVEHFLRRA